VFHHVIPCFDDKRTRSSLKYDKFIIKEIQKKMVLCCHDFDFAIDAWGLIIAPLLLDLPKIGNITTSTRKFYFPIPSPVMTGTSVYVDSNTCILSLGELASLPLSGIRTSKGDTGCSSSKYLNFLVSDPCTLFICWPEKSRVAKWVTKRGFFRTNYKVTTSSSTMIVFAKQLNVASMVTLGGCANAPSKYDNFFILLSRPFTPSYAKMRPDELARFQLSREIGQIPHETTGNLKFDLSMFQWNLHRDTNLFDPHSTNNATDLLGDTSTLDGVSGAEPALEHCLPIHSRTRSTWKFSAKLGLLSLQYNHQPQGPPLMKFQIERFSLTGSVSHVEGVSPGVIPRLDSGFFQLEFEFSLKSAGCPQLPSADIDHLETSDLRLSTSLEYLIEPTFFLVDTSKEEGRSKVMMKLGTPSHINMNLSPWQLYALNYFSLPLCRLLSSSGNGNGESINHSSREHTSSQSHHDPILNLVVENKLGQDIHLKVLREDEYGYPDDDEDDRRVFHCSISSDCAVKLGFSLADIKTCIQSLSFDVDTNGWYSVPNISISYEESLEVYPMRPKIFSQSRANSCCSEEWGGEQTSRTWQNSTSTPLENATPIESPSLRRNPFSKQLSSLIDNFATAGSFESEDKTPFGMTVRCKPMTSSLVSEDSDLVENVVDCGLIFRTDTIDTDSEFDGDRENASSSSSHSHLPESSPPSVTCTLVVTLSSNIYLVNSAECSLSVSVPDDQDDDLAAFEIESGDVFPLPLQVLHPSNSFLSLQRVWGLDKWLPEPFDFAVTRHSFNIQTPPRLRISRDQENQSIWISALESPSLFPGSGNVKCTQHSNLLPLDDIDENSLAGSEKDLELESHQFEDQVAERSAPTTTTTPY
jgi:hypothetical protein